MPANRSYSFGEYTLDLKRGALLRTGVDVKLRPKSFEVLRLLLERHGRLVTKDELLNAVWGHAVVTDGAVGQCLVDLRRVIGDESQQVIRTVPRRGYIFDFPVVASEDAVIQPHVHPLQSQYRIVPAAQSSCARSPRSSHGSSSWMEYLVGRHDARESRGRAAPTERCAGAAQLDCRLTVHRPESRAESAIFFRWRFRGDPEPAGASAGSASDRSYVFVLLQGSERRHRRDCCEAECR